MPYDISQMAMEDYDQVVEFWRDQEGLGLNESDSRENIARYLERNPDMSFVARDGGQVVGAVLCGHEGRRGYMHHLAVAPSHRNLGLGRVLVDRCMDQLRAAGISRCNIFLFADNHDAKRFWRAVGFVERRDLTLLQRVIDGRC